MFAVRWLHTDALGTWVAPLPRLLGAAGLLAAQTATQSLAAAMALLVLSLILALLSGKKISLSYFLILALGIVGFALLSPIGRVMFSWGPLRITQGALEEGLLRAARLIGMVFTSLAGIHRNLRLPGSLGQFWSEVLGYYQRLLEVRRRITLRDWIHSLDEVFQEVLPIESLENGQPTLAPPEEGPRFRGWWAVPLAWGVALSLLLGFRV